MVFGSHYSCQHFEAVKSVLDRDYFVSAHFSDNGIGINFREWDPNQKAMVSRLSFWKPSERKIYDKLDGKPERLFQMFCRPIDGFESILVFLSNDVLLPYFKVSKKERDLWNYEYSSLCVKQYEVLSKQRKKLADKLSQISLPQNLNRKKRNNYQMFSRFLNYKLLEREEPLNVMRSKYLK